MYLCLHIYICIYVQHDTRHIVLYIYCTVYIYIHYIYLYIYTVCTLHLVLFYSIHANRNHALTANLAWYWYPHVFNFDPYPNVDLPF